MPADVGSHLRPASPSLSEDALPKRDKNYRRYAATVEKALSLFDTTLQAWADYVSFLGRLLKALQAKPNGVNEIPHSGLVAKRLAQCVDPRLPSGVHQKALEVYAFVFSILGREGLSRELTLYLPGLSPLLSFASLSVKPALLSIYETSIVSLDPIILQPALKAINLALLPGLEDATSEEFERVHAIIEKLKFSNRRTSVGEYSITDKVRDRYFWQSLFLAAITSPSRRAGALQYFIRNLPNMGQSLPSRNGSAPASKSQGSNSEAEAFTEIEAVTSPEPGLLIRSFAAGLRDEQVLVQRGFLDLLVTKLPLSSDILQREVKSKDLDILISSASSVVARREMSLNRRLWAWFLGPEVSKDSEDIVTPKEIQDTAEDTATPMRSPNRYFQTFGFHGLIRSLSNLIGEASIIPSTRAKPFRISLSLMDRAEIGNVVIPQIFVPLMESIWRYERTAPSNDCFSEVLRSAHVFFDGVQSRIIWKEICQLIYQAFNPKLISGNEAEANAMREKLDLVWFIITKFNVREEEMLVTHMPMACLLLLSGLCRVVKADELPQTPKFKENIKVSLRIVSRMMEYIPERALDGKSETENLENSPANIASPKGGSRIDGEAILHSYADQKWDSNQKLHQMSAGQNVQSLLDCSEKLLISAIKSSGSDIDLDASLTVASKIIRKSSGINSVGTERILSALLHSSEALLPDSKQIPPFQDVSGLVAVFEFLGNVATTEHWTKDHRVRQISVKLVELLWPFFSPHKPQHAVEATRCLWRVNANSPSTQIVESTICSLMIARSKRTRSEIVTLEGARRLATLWTQTTSKFRSSSDRRSSLGRGKRSESLKAPVDFDEMDILARPLALLLDCLSEPLAPLLNFTVSWLQSLPSIQIIMDFLVHRLQSTRYITEIRLGQNNSSNIEQIGHAEKVPPAADCLYFIRRISDLLRFSPVNASDSLKSIIISSDAVFENSIKSSSLEHVTTSTSKDETDVTTWKFLVILCVDILKDKFSEDRDQEELRDVSRAAVELLQQLLREPAEAPKGLDLEPFLINVLSNAILKYDLLIQGPLIETLSLVMRERPLEDSKSPGIHRRSFSQTSSLNEKGDREPSKIDNPLPSPGLLDCLILGLRSSQNRPMLDQWIRFLGECLPLYEGHTFQILIPLVDCFRKSIDEVFDGLKASFGNASPAPPSEIEPINTINILLNGLEQTLARGHEQLLREEASAVPLKSPEQSQSFFGNMVSGVFASEVQKARSATANDRLTVLICFKDSIRIAFNMWSWGDTGGGKVHYKAGSSASFSYASIRLRNRARRLLEHLFAAEPLESLETLVEVWRETGAGGQSSASPTTLNLLHALDASRPKNTIPTTFNALYSRTSPLSLDARRTSTLTSDLSDSALAEFLVAYTRSIDDDALDEIWMDCVAFLKDVLGNPMPQRQILPRLLDFTAILGEKIDNTNFGEQKRMRREIGDLFVRLLAATFTVRPLAFSQDPVLPISPEKYQEETVASESIQSKESPEDVVSILAAILPQISALLVDTDRIAAVSTLLSTQVLGPTFRSRRYPHSVTSSTLEILKLLARVPEISKTWKKDAAEAFHDPRFFGATNLSLAKDGWMPILKQWALVDKERMADLLTRLTGPATAGIMFGVGASSARQEADRKAQLNLRRITLLLIAADHDDFLVNISAIQEKIVELCNATVSSSPSSSTRAEIFMVMRALTLKVSTVHLASLWPILDNELYNSLSSLTEKNSPTPSEVTVALQAAKLLDLLLTVAPDDFQLREWLYVTDTIDAVYRSSDWKPVALVDNLADRLETLSGTQPPSAGAGARFVEFQQHDGVRRPLLRWDRLQGLRKDQEIIDKVLRPFLRHLSITAFESMYQMETADRDACVEELLKDLFDETTLV